MNEEYKQTAENVVSQMRKELGVELKYDRESIEWLDGYINRIRPHLKKESYLGLATALGAYLGESIIATYGGTWHYSESLEKWGVQLQDGSVAFPFSKVYKQIEDGEFESVLSFFTVLPVIMQDLKE